MIRFQVKRPAFLFHLIIQDLYPFISILQVLDYTLLFPITGPSLQLLPLYGSSHLAKFSSSRSELNLIFSRGRSYPLLPNSRLWNRPQCNSSPSPHFDRWQAHQWVPQKFCTPFIRSKMINILGCGGRHGISVKTSNLCFYSKSICRQYANCKRVCVPMKFLQKQTTGRTSPLAVVWWPWPKTKYDFSVIPSQSFS